MCNHVCNMRMLDKTWSVETRQKLGKLERKYCLLELKKIVYRFKAYIFFWAKVMDDCDLFYISHVCLLAPCPYTATQLLLLWYLTQVKLHCHYTTLHFYYTTLLLHYTVTIQLCHYTILHCHYTTLSLYYTVTIQYYTVTELNCQYTTLSLHYTVTRLYCRDITRSVNDIVRYRPFWAIL